MNIPLDRLLLAASLLLLTLAQSHATPNDDASAASARSIQAGRPTVAKVKGASSVLVLTVDQQRQSGLRTERLEAAALQPETQAYGKVLDIRGLLDLRARFRAAQSEMAIADAALRVAQKSRQRLASLHRESIIATRDLLQAEAQLAADQARTEAARRRMREARDEALQTWGGELFRQAIEGESRLFEELLQRRQALILIALPTDRSLPNDARLAKIAPTGDRQNVREARLVSSAPRTDETIQGETWFFAAEADRLRTGMRLDAWIPLPGDASEGVTIPLSAVVWYDGKPWVYLKTGEQSFSRRPIPEHRDYGTAWFVGEGFTADEEVVATGGQMLLSEELRGQIPDEDDD
jgi:hypothetical protein